MAKRGRLAWSIFGGCGAGKAEPTVHLGSRFELPRSFQRCVAYQSDGQHFCFVSEYLRLFEKPHPEWFRLNDTYHCAGPSFELGRERNRAFSSPIKAEYRAVIRVNLQGTAFVPIGVLGKRDFYREGESLLNIGPVEFTNALQEIAYMI